MTISTDTENFVHNYMSVYEWSREALKSHSNTRDRLCQYMAETKITM